jgi:hypothetical protein
MSPGAQKKKTRPDALGTAENDSGVQNMKTGRPRTALVPPKTIPDAPVPPKTSPGAHKIKTDPTPSVQPKMSPGAQNKKTIPVAPLTAENESGSA